MQDYEVVIAVLEDAGLDVSSVQRTNQPDQFIVELVSIPPTQAALQKAFLNADFVVIGWHNGNGYRCLVRDVAYVVERRVRSA